MAVAVLPFAPLLLPDACALRTQTRHRDHQLRRSLQSRREQQNWEAKKWGAEQEEEQGAVVVGGEVAALRRRQIDTERQCQIISISTALQYLYLHRSALQVRQSARARPRRALCPVQ